MTSALPTWARKHYQRPGGRPFLFYVVFGRFSELPALPSAYRSKGVYPGLDLFDYSQEEHPEVVASFREGYLWDEFARRDPQLAAEVMEADECLVLKGEIEDCETLDYLRDSIGLLTFLLDHGGLAIYDPQRFQWWSKKDWKERLFVPAAAVPREHVVILVSEEDRPSGSQKLMWFHTRGMRKFGRPDISVHNVPPQLHKAAFDLCNRFIEFQAFGGIIEEGEEIKIKDFSSGTRCRHAGHLDDPDFNNLHVEVVLPSSGGVALPSR